MDSRWQKMDHGEDDGRFYRASKVKRGTLLTWRREERHETNIEHNFYFVKGRDMADVDPSLW